MVLIVGGEGSGKRSFAQTLGFAPEEMADGAFEDRVWRWLNEEAVSYEILDEAGKIIDAVDSGAEPVVVLTKADLCQNPEDKLAQVRTAAPGAEILTVSSLTGDTDAVLPYILPGRTVAFLGSSGVGKSTLINKLMGTSALATGAVGTADKGRHTTTHRQLLTLPNGAFLIDTPGMRELGMWDSDGGIDTAFQDLLELTRACRFSNCTHTAEPGCAVLKALADGTLDAGRWESFRKLKLENGRAAAHSRYLDAKREKFKEIAKINKANKKDKRS